MKQAELIRRLTEMTNGVNRQQEFIKLTAPVESTVRGLYTVTRPDLREAKELLAEHLNQQIFEANKKLREYIIKEAREIALAFAELEAIIDEKDSIINDMHDALRMEQDAELKRDLEGR